MGINVLSLFGGIECGKVAMDRLGIEVDKYFSSEVDEYAIKITQKNHPDIIHIGSVLDVQYIPERKLLCGSSDTNYFVDIDIVIGGPPCQDLSAAKANRKGLEGEKSSLFYEYVRVLKEVKPRYFLMENVASMKNADKDTITNTLKEIYPDVQVYMLDSRKVSGQKRKRYFWTNIQGVTEPEDRNILLSDILEDIKFDEKDEKGKNIWKPLDPKFINEKLKEKIYDKSYAITATYSGVCPRDCLDKYNRQIILGVYQKGRGKNEGGIVQEGDKSPTINAHRFESNNFVVGQFRRTNLRVHAEQEKSCTLTANMGTGGNNVPIIMEEQDQVIYWRPLTPIECERLQTLEDNYTEGVAKTRRYKAIGNGWTVEVIVWILSFISEWKKQK